MPLTKTCFLIFRFPQGPGPPGAGVHYVVCKVHISNRRPRADMRRAAGGRAMCPHHHRQAGRVFLGAGGVSAYRQLYFGNIGGINQHKGIVPILRNAVRGLLFTCMFTCKHTPMYGIHGCMLARKHQCEQQPPRGFCKYGHKGVRGLSENQIKWLFKPLRIF